MKKWLQLVRANKLCAGSTIWVVVVKIQDKLYRYEGSYWMYSQFKRRFRFGQAQALAELKKLSTKVERLEEVSDEVRG